MSLDGFAILKSVGGNAELFSEARDVVDKAALNILAAEFKAKTFDLDHLKRAYKILGADTLSLVLEHCYRARNILGHSPSISSSMSCLEPRHCGGDVNRTTAISLHSLGDVPAAALAELTKAAN